MGAEMNVSEESKDTLRRIKAITYLKLAKPELKHEEAFNICMTCNEFYLHLIESFKPDHEWIKEIYEHTAPIENKVKLKLIRNINED